MKKMLLLCLMIGSHLVASQSAQNPFPYSYIPGQEDPDEYTIWDPSNEPPDRLELIRDLYSPEFASRPRGQTFEDIVRNRKGEEYLADLERQFIAEEYPYQKREGYFGVGKKVRKPREPRPRSVSRPLKRFPFDE